MAFELLTTYCTTHLIKCIFMSSSLNSLMSRVYLNLAWTCWCSVKFAGYLSVIELFPLNLIPRSFPPTLRRAAYPPFDKWKKAKILTKEWKLPKNARLKYLRLVNSLSICNLYFGEFLGYFWSERQIGLWKFVITGLPGYRVFELERLIDGLHIIRFSAW